MHSHRVLVVFVSLGLIGQVLAGCGAVPDHASTPAASGTAEDTAILPDVSVADLLPTGKEYTDFNNGLSWGATTSSLAESDYAQLVFGSAGASAVDFGESCAQALAAATSVDATVVDAASQEIGINSADEFAYLIRYESVDQAKNVFDAQVALAQECSKNQGTATYTPIDVNLENTVAYLNRLPSTDDDFVGFGRRGDLLAVVFNTNDDAAEVGPKTIQYIMNNLSDKVTKG